MTRTRTIFIRNWMVETGIGIHPHEQNKKQKLRINITFLQKDTIPFLSTRIADVVDYEVHKNAIQDILDARHEPLLETLAERIAQSCLADPLVLQVTVELEKMHILSGTESCGVKIERMAGDYH